MSNDNYLELDNILMRDTKLVCFNSTGVERAIKKYNISSVGQFLRANDNGTFMGVRNTLFALELEGIAALLKFKYYGLDMEVIPLLERKFYFKQTDEIDSRGEVIKVIYFGDKRLGNRYEYNSSINSGMLSSLGFNESEVGRILKDLQLLPNEIEEISLINYFKVAFERYKDIIAVNKQSVSLHVFYEKISLYLKYYELKKKTSFDKLAVSENILTACNRRGRR